MVGPTSTMFKNQVHSRIDVCDEKCLKLDEEEIQRNAVCWTIYSCAGQQSIQTTYSVNLRNYIGYWISEGKITFKEFVGVAMW